MSKKFDVIIIGAGGAGLMCAIEAGKRGRKVAILDHNKKVGQKILISGGGRCNFTNIHARAECYLSENKHFCKSALSQFSPRDMIHLVEKHGISYHEKKLGQQFSDVSAKDILNMLLKETKEAKVNLINETVIDGIQKKADIFEIRSSKGTFSCSSLVVATGGLSIPKIGATDFGYKIARQFNIKTTQVTPALVPFTFFAEDLNFYEGLSGISIDAEVSIGKRMFRENVLITHRGVSGPAILQISSYWEKGQSVKISMLPDIDFIAFLQKKRSENTKVELKTALSEILPKRFVQALIDHKKIKNPIMGQLSDKYIHQLSTFFKNYIIKPSGTEGYKKAEVTRGGVSTEELNARTLESKEVKGLYFVGEVVDVTGWLGGYNFQWAWSSGFAAGQVV